MALEIVKFLFGDFWHWLGLLLIIYALRGVSVIKITKRDK